MRPRPISVTLIGCVYIGMGLVGFAYHLPELRAAQPNSVWVEVVRLSAVVIGAFLLRGRNWARWLALVWMALHVAISVLHSYGEFAMHLVFLAILGWLLFRPDARRYFSERSGSLLEE